MHLRRYDSVMTKKMYQAVYSGPAAGNNRTVRITMRAFTKRVVTWCSVLLMIMQQAVFAQTRIAEVDLDIDPPVIDHEALEVGVAGEQQTFSALVIDDKGIDYVDLYYRSGSSREYSKVPMQLNGTKQYVATVPTELAQARIEYYIEAADTGGNRVLKGFPFFPLVRNLDVPAPVAPVVTTSNGESADTGGSKLLYVLLGALAVGLLASAGSSGEDDGGGSGEQVPLTINISSPAN